MHGIVGRVGTPCMAALVLSHQLESGFAICLPPLISPFLSCEFQIKATMASKKEKRLITVSSTAVRGTNHQQMQLFLWLSQKSLIKEDVSLIYTSRHIAK